MATPAGSFIWYELMTPDADEASRFYGSVIGWHIADRPDPNSPGRDYRMIVRSGGGHAGGVLQLSPEMQASGAAPCWLTYLQVEDVAATAKAITADGGQVHMQMSLPVGDVAMVSDPMGTVFYIMRPVPPPGQPDAVSDVFHPTATQRVRWNELVTPDLARAKAFYSRHFGYAFNEPMSMGNMGEYCFFDHGGVRPGAMMQQVPDLKLGGWVFYFGVPSVLAAKRAIEAGGGHVLMGPHEVPGGDWVVVATDPRGAVFGVTGPQGQ